MPELLDRLVLINGVPATGKSTLAAHLASRLSMPRLGKDDIKEALWDASPPRPGVEPLMWSKRLGAMAYELLWRLAPGLGPGLVVEAPLTARHIPSIAQLHPRPIEIYLTATPEVILGRHTERQEVRHECHRFHPLPELTDLVAGMAVTRPLDLGGPLLAVDTTEGLDLEAVTQWLRRELERSAGPRPSGS